MDAIKNKLPVCVMAQMNETDKETTRAVYDWCYCGMRCLSIDGPRCTARLLKYDSRWSWADDESRWRRPRLQKAKKDTKVRLVRVNFLAPIEMHDDDASFG